ncbi:MAG: hypothetical protein H6581_20535 [Bacteroidia bacterium]|nr:hypothetical protein [Bacteroidia bacterium]
MKRIAILFALLFVGVATSPISTMLSGQIHAQTASVQSLDNETLNQLFEIASTKWPASVEDLWGDYSDAVLRVTEVNGDFELDHLVHGGLSIQSNELGG